MVASPLWENLVEQRASGWMPHDGGERPENSDDRVRVRLRSGKVMRVARAGSRIWEHARVSIPAYQIVQFEVVVTERPR